MPKEHCMLLPLTEMHGIPTNLLDQSGCRMARCDFDGTVNVDAIKNAKYIKRAVNSYADMLAALQAIVASDDQAYADLASMNVTPVAGLMELTENARAAIKKATE